MLSTIDLSKRTVKISFSESDKSIIVKIHESNGGEWNLLGMHKVEPRDDIDKYWLFIAKTLTEEECEELIMYETDLEDIFLEANENITRRSCLICLEN